MKYQIIKKDKTNYSTSAWSGGATTEIQIMPENCRYTDRDFLWRLSSATVEVEESTFTALPDYDRLIMMLEGEMDLCHNDGPWIRLAEFEPHGFDGGDQTLSRGKVTDFNLMLRKGKCRGAIVPMVFSADVLDTGVGAVSCDTVVSVGHMTSTALVPKLQSCCGCVVYCHCGPLYITMEDGRKLELQSGESLQMSGDFSDAMWTFCGGDGVRAVLAAVWNIA